jgi:hypothetical protein
MFEQAWRTCLERFRDLRPQLPADPRARLQTIAMTYFDFAVSDLPRHQLMDVRIVTDFQPSHAAYAPSLECFELFRAALREIGVRRAADVDLYTALMSGLVELQLANDPGGVRWRRLLPRAVSMFADDLGLPATQHKRSVNHTQRGTR